MFNLRIRGKSRLALLAAAAVSMSACGGDPDGPACNAVTVTPVYIETRVGVPVRAIWQVPATVIGFSVGSHPAWNQWTLLRGTNEILLVGLPDEPMTQQITFVLQTVCGEATVNGGTINVGPRQRF
jgi:hypothetical protein